MCGAEIIHGLIPPVHIRISVRHGTAAECLKLGCIVSWRESVICKSGIHSRSIGICICKFRISERGVQSESVLYADVSAVSLAPPGGDHEHAIAATHSVKCGRSCISKHVDRFYFFRRDVCKRAGEAIHKDQRLVPAQKQGRDIVRRRSRALKHVQTGDLAVKGLGHIDGRGIFKCL